MFKTIWLLLSVAVITKTSNDFITWKDIYYIDSSTTSLSACTSFSGQYTFYLDYQLFGDLDISRSLYNRTDFSYYPNDAFLRTAYDSVPAPFTLAVNGIPYTNPNIWFNTYYTPSPRISMTYTNAVVAFKTGIESPNYLMISSVNMISFYPPKISLIASSFSNTAVSYTNSTSLATSCITLTLGNPCAFLPNITAFKITIPKITSVNPAYEFNSFSAFDTSACLVYVNNVRPTTVACSLLNDSLTITNAFTIDYYSSNLNLKLCNILTPYSGLSNINVLAYNGDTNVSSKLFINSTLTSTTVKPILNVSNKVLTNSGVGQPFIYKFTFNCSVPYMLSSDYYIKFNFPSYFSNPTNNISFDIKDLSTGITQTQTVPTNSMPFNVVLGINLYLSTGVEIKMYGINNPSTPINGNILAAVYKVSPSYQMFMNMVLPITTV